MFWGIFFKLYAKNIFQKSDRPMALQVHNVQDISCYTETS